MKSPLTLIIITMIVASCSDRLTFTGTLSAVGTGWSKTMVNATMFRNNSIVSYNGHQYVAYYDSDSNVVLGKRKLGKSQWSIFVTAYKGNTHDAHNSISLAVDAKGYLHMAWDQHNNKLNYCRSIAAESIEMGSKEVMIGADEGSVTYPEFYRLRRGNLLFLYRDGSSGNGNLVMNRYDVNTRMWTRIQNNLISGDGVRNAYWQAAVDDDGAIHLSWTWRENHNVETNHDICYAVSRDEGKIWKKSNGEKYSLPINASSAEYAVSIPQRSDLINQTSMTVDSRGNPFIATYYHSPADRCPQYYVIMKTENGWEKMRVTNRSSNFTLAGVGTRRIPISRPKILSLRKNGRDFLLMLYRDEERGDKVSVTWSRVRNPEWQTMDLTDFPVMQWEPSIDPYLWRRKRLHVYVQKVGQESGEISTELDPQPVSILQVKWK